MLVRSVNALANVGEKLGVQSRPLVGSEIVDRLVRRFAHTKCDSAKLELLKGAISSAEEGDGLSAFGRWSVQQVAGRIVRNHLWIEGMAENGSSMFDEPVVEPIFIIGWYRSGTTLLHRLLATSADVSAPLAYDLYYPRPGGMPGCIDRNWRMAKMAGMLKLARLTIPELDGLHSIRARSAEESTVLLDNAGVGVYFLHAFGSHSHGEQLAIANLKFAYRSMRQQMQVLRSRNKARARWLMKCPFSLGRLDTLLDVFPDAHVVHIRRDVSDSLNSVCNLSAILQGCFRNRVAMHDIGRFWFRFYLDEITRVQAVLDRTSVKQVVYVNYDELVQAPDDVVRSIATNVGIRINDSCLALPGTIGRPVPCYRYNLAAFGLSRAEIDAQFLQTRPVRRQSFPDA